MTRSISITIPLAAVLGMPLWAGCKPPVAAASYLTITSISPSHGALGVAPDTTVVATFSEDLVGDSVQSSTMMLEDPSAQSVPATLRYEGDHLSATLTPSVPLEEGDRYTLVLTTGLEGKDSGPLVADVRATFLVGGAEGGASDELPVADAGPDMSAQRAEQIVLDGGASYDPEGAALSYQWDVLVAPDGADVGLGSPDQASTTFQADLEGVYTVSLVVNDGVQDSDPDYLEVDVGAAGDGDTGQ